MSVALVAVLDGMLDALLERQLRPARSTHSAIVHLPVNGSVSAWMTGKRLRQTWARISAVLDNHRSHRGKLAFFGVSTQRSRLARSMHDSLQRIVAFRDSYGWRAARCPGHANAAISRRSLCALLHDNPSRATVAVPPRHADARARTCSVRFPPLEKGDDNRRVDHV